MASCNGHYLPIKGRQTNVAGIGDQHVVFDPNADLSGAVKSRLDGEDHSLRDAGTDPGPPKATGGQVLFLRARMANEVLKAQTAKVRP